LPGADDDFDGDGFDGPFVEEPGGVLDVPAEFFGWGDGVAEDELFCVGVDFSASFGGGVTVGVGGLFEGFDDGLLLEMFFVLFVVLQQLYHKIQRNKCKKR
jgi:hypothetical protein